MLYSLMPSAAAAVVTEYASGDGLGSLVGRVVGFSPVDRAGWLSVDGGVDRLSGARRDWRGSVAGGDDRSPLGDGFDWFSAW